MTRSKQYHIINIVLWFSQTHEKLVKCFHKLYTISYTSLALEFILQWNIIDYCRLKVQFICHARTLWNVLSSPMMVASKKKWCSYLTSVSWTRLHANHALLSCLPLEKILPEKPEWHCYRFYNKRNKLKLLILGDKIDIKLM